MKLATLAAAGLLAAAVAGPAPAGAAVPAADQAGTVQVATAQGSRTITVLGAGTTDLTTGQAADFEVEIDTPEPTGVRLQQRTPDGAWADVAAQPVAVGDADYHLPIPTGTPGAVTVRVVVDAGATIGAFTSGPYDFTVTDPPVAEKPTSITLKPPSVLVTPVGRRLSVTGTVSGGSARTVRLELRTPSGWMRLGTGVTDGAGRYSVRVPTDWYYAGTLRTTVVANGDYASASSGGTFAMRVTPAYRPGGHAGQRAFLTRARWNPCRPITYRVNTTGGPRSALRQVKRALAQVHAATGFRFAYQGATTAVPFRTDHRGRALSDADLTIGFGTDRQVGGLRGSVVGLGGPSWSGSRIVSGGVVLDRAARRFLRPGFGSGPTWGTLMLHEIGHAMGLGHVDEAREVMHQGIGRWSQGHYQAGDLAGLRKLGAMGGCTDRPAQAAADILGQPVWDVRR